ncbi:MAG: hypothetical protein IT350_16470 [Deltaproteobacteria bacterium]|nr:hypothetical protein [Deltaproteobacteria bacterium]
MSKSRFSRHFEFLLGILLVLFTSLLVFGCGDDDDDDSSDDTPPDDDTDDDPDDDTADDDTTDDDTDDDTTDDDTADDDTTDDDTADDDTADDDTADDDTEETYVNFHLFDAETEADVEGVTCTIVDPVSGEPIAPAIVETSDSDGVCAFLLADEPAQISVRFEAGDYVTHYRFYVETNSEVDQFMLSEELRDIIAGDLSVTIDPLDGIVFGVVQWASAGGVEYVGCSDVTHDAGGGELFYTDETGFPSVSQTSTSLAFSAFAVFNVPAGGPYTFEADTDGEMTETSANKVFAEALTFFILSYREELWPDNPTPVGCT